MWGIWQWSELQDVRSLMMMWITGCEEFDNEVNFKMWGV